MQKNKPTSWIFCVVASRHDCSCIFRSAGWPNCNGEILRRSHWFWHAVERASGAD